MTERALDLAGSKYTRAVAPTRFILASLTGHTDVVVGQHVVNNLLTFNCGAIATTTHLCTPYMYVRWPVATVLSYLFLLYSKNVLVLFQFEGYEYGNPECANTRCSNIVHIVD